MNTSEPEYDEREIEVLMAIRDAQPEVRQRQIARALGMSLGLTNAILKRLARRGWLQVRRINARNIHYVVAPHGLEVIARRSYRYLRRTIGHIVRYKDAIAALATTARRDGYTCLCVVGVSDLAFLVEHFASKYGLHFTTAPKVGDRPGTLWLVGEQSPIAVDELRSDVQLLAQLLLALT